MKLLFWLYKSQANRKGQCPVMMRITINGSRTNFPTQLSIEEKSWDHDRQHVKGNDDLTRKYNQHLLTMKTKAWELYDERLKTGEQISGQEIKSYILGTDQSAHTLVEAMDYHINQIKARVGHDMAPATIQRYETSKCKVLQFLREKKGEDDIFLYLVNHQFIHELDAFLRSCDGLKNNGVVKNMQQLKRMIKLAHLNEWIKKDPFVHYRCKIEEPKRVHLTVDELAHLESIQLPSERLERTRNVFVFSCYTGLAYADASKLAWHHIQEIEGTRWIMLDRTKTKNQSSVPLLSQEQAILDQYAGQGNDRLLPLISSQNMNKYLKEVAALAGIRKRLTFHAARHTFATTVTLNQGVDIVSVSAMLGHRMLKTTQIYAKVNMQKI